MTKCADDSNMADESCSDVDSTSASLGKPV